MGGALAPEGPPELDPGPGRVTVLGAAGLALLALIVAGSVLARLSASGPAADGQTREAVRLSASAARVAHELQRERDHTAYFLASGRERNYGTVVAHRVLVDQGVRAFQGELAQLGTGGLRDHPSLGPGLARARDALRALGDFREGRIDAGGGGLTTVAALRWYDQTVAALIDVAAAAADEAPEPVREGILAHLAVARFKEALARERAYLYAAYGGGGFATAADPAGRRVPFAVFSAIAAEADHLRAEAERLAAPAWRERLGSALASGDAISSAEVAAAVLADPGMVSRVPAGAAKDWLFDMNSTVDAVRAVELPMLDDAITPAEAAGFRLW